MKTVSTNPSDSDHSFSNERLGNVRVSLGLIGLRVWLNYTCVVFVSGGWVGEQKLRRVVYKPAHPPLARQRCKRIIKCTHVKHEICLVCKTHKLCSKPVLQ